MAFEASTATDLTDLINKLFTFATANGWTQDEKDTASATRHATMHINTVYVSFAWVASPSHLNIFQSLGWINNTTDPWDHTDDSGGIAVVSQPTSRGAESIGNGSFTYNFFQGNASDEYIYVTVELSDGTFRHFGFGEIEKFGVWTGGEFCYGTNWNDSQDPTLTSQNCGMDGGLADASSSSRERASTLHIEGFADMVAAQKWGAVGGGLLNTFDRGSNARANIAATFRAGPVAHAFGWMPENTFNQFVPLLPIDLYFFEDVLSPLPDKLYYLGKQPDVAMINMNNFNPYDEITVDSATWRIIPAIKKTTLSVSQESRNLGFAYKKLV